MGSQKRVPKARRFQPGNPLNSSVGLAGQADNDLAGNDQAGRREGYRLERPDKPRGFVRERQPQTFRFKDDGLIPNHPRWPLIIYEGAVRLALGLDPAAVFEELFDSHGWGRSWRDGIYDYAHYHSRIHEVLGIARGSGRCNSAERTGVSSTSRPAMSLSFRQARGINA